MRSWLYIIVSCFSFSFSFGQEEKIDSVLRALSTETDPVHGIELHFEAAELLHENDNPDDCEDHLQLAKRIAKAAKNDTLLSEAHRRLGDLYYVTENGPGAIDNYHQALRVIGGTDSKDRRWIYNRLGILYLVFEEYEKSIVEFKNAIAADKEIISQGGTTHINLYNNVALAFMELYEFDSSWYYHQECLRFRMEKGNPYEIGQSYNNLGSLFYAVEQYDSSLIYFEKSLVFREDSATRVESSVYESKINIGKAMVALKQYSKAEKLLKDCRVYTIETSNPVLELRILEQLMRLYSETGRYNQAYESAVNYYQLRDNLYGIEKREEVIRLNHEHMYEQKLMHDSLLTVEQERAAQIQQAKNEEIQSQKNRVNLIIQIGLAVALILMLGIVILGYRNYRAKQRSAEEILFQKNEAEKQRDLASEQRDLAESQRLKLEEINQEITDSITYAKRIQKAILPSQSAIERALSKSFVYYQPKAIVAGDFYWVQEAKEGVYFAAADCTGHGVPGAMVSVICSNALNRCVEEYGLTEPGEILDKTMDLLIEQLVTENENVKDGMDISLCFLKHDSSIIKYAGANNSLYILPKDSEELVELKPTKQGIGWSDNRIRFETQTLEVSKGDLIYSFTDGFPDQFGGERGKKYKYKRFKEFLLGIKQENMRSQKELIAKEFESWKGDLEQVDDICIIGVRV